MDDGHVRVDEPSGAMPVDGRGGWGLHLVGAPSRSWGTGFDREGRTLVWAEVPLPTTRQPATR